MNRFVRLLKTHTLWVGFVAVVIPLILMLGLQYFWLCKLEQTSAIARQATLRNTLETMATEVEFFYHSAAERLLNVPSAPFQDGDLNKIARQWGKKPTEGIRRLFLIDYTRQITGNFYAYDQASQVLQPTQASDESLAIVIASLPWQARVREAVSTEAVGFQVNEQDPLHRIILSPVTDDMNMIVGIVAMILDEDYFKKSLLPGIVEKTLTAFFPQESRQNLAVNIQDPASQNHAAHHQKAPARSLRFSFVFTDWAVSLRSQGSSATEWARGSFLFNMTLAVLLGIVLLGGIGLALRAANRAMKLSEMKSDFVSNVSHELRTPLASIRVFAEHLRLGRATSPEKVEEYGEYIEVESHRLSRLIDNILDFSRIETECKTYRFQPTDLSEVIKTVMKSHAVRLHQSGFEVTLHQPDSQLPQVLADPDALGQALHNLLDNAAKYSRETKSIAVRLSRQDNSVMVSVQDQGVGIAADEQARIFNRFHRVGTGLVHDIKGNGLGLSIVRHIVRAHGGTVTVESELGRGSTFFLRLPIPTSPSEGADHA